MNRKRKVRIPIAFSAPGDGHSYSCVIGASVSYVD